MLFIRVTMFIRVTRDMFTVTRVITMIWAKRLLVLKRFISLGY